MVQENHMQVHFDAKSVNEGLARMVVTAFMTNMNPTLEQIADVKTAVSEAVTNAIIHGYEDETKQVELTCDQNGQQLVATVSFSLMMGSAPSSSSRVRVFWKFSRRPSCSTSTPVSRICATLWL